MLYDLETVGARIFWATDTGPLPDETKAATVVKHPALGRLLIFDATSPNTPVGDLPESEQPSHAQGWTHLVGRLAEVAGSRR